jgi:hypothetical protein
MKKNVLNIKVIKVLVIALVLGLSSCGVGNSYLTPTLPIATTSQKIDGQVPTISPTMPNAPVVSPIPTKTGDQRVEYLLGLIQNPGNCRFPCWWGMTPGITSWREAEDFISALGLGEFDLESQNNVDFRVDLDKLQLYQRLRIERQANLISRIAFVVDGTSKPENLKSVWNSYALAKMLALYGKPSRVMLYTHFGNRAVYSLLLFYDQGSFLLEYGGLATMNNGIVRICPMFRDQEDIFEIRFFLQDQASTEPLENMFEGYKGMGPFMQSLDTSTGLSIDQLMVLAKGESFCFDAPNAILR